MTQGTVTIKRVRDTYAGGIQFVTVRAVGTAADITRLHALGRVEVGAMYIGKDLWEARLAGDQDELLKRTDQELQQELNDALERSGAELLVTDLIERGRARDAVAADPIHVATLLHTLMQIAADPSEAEVEGFADRLTKHLRGRGRIITTHSGMPSKRDAFAMLPRALVALLVDAYSGGFEAARMSTRLEKQIRSTVPPCGVCGEGRVFVTLPCPHCGATGEGVNL